LAREGSAVVSARILVRAGKGGRPRSVDLPAAGVGALVRYLPLRVEGPSRPLFQWLDGSGRGIGYWTVYRVVVEAARAAGLGHVAPHDLRRTWITRALDGGVPAPEVRRQAGHGDLGQTVRYYREGR
jgi:integrase/recombinase XerC/integrase/recombinase XerD